MTDATSHSRGRRRGRTPTDAAPRRGNRRRSSFLPALVALLVAALLAGCTSTASPADRPEAPAGVAGPSVNVSPSQGGTATAAGATLTIPAAAVTTATVAHLKASSISILQQLLGGSRDRTKIFEPVGAPVEADLSGQQPARPLTLTFPVPAALGASRTLAVLTTHQGVTSVLRGTLSADHRTYTVAVPRLSRLQLISVNPDALFKTLKDAFPVALKISDFTPSCVGQPATLPDGTQVSITGAYGPIWPCVTASGSNVQVTVHDSDALPWQVSSDAGQYAGPRDTETRAFLVQEIYTRLAVNRTGGQGLVLPQGEGQWTIPADQLPTRMTATVSEGAWLAAVSVFAVFFLSDVAAGGKGGGTAVQLAERMHRLTDQSAGWDCLLAAARTVPGGSAATAQQLATVFQAAVGCIPTLYQDVFKFGIGALTALILDVIDSGAALAYAGFEGAVLTAERDVTTSWQVERTSPPAAGVGGCERTLPTYPVLLPGASGPAVRTLQCLLNDDGQGPVVVDGWYGPQTRAALDGFNHEGTGPFTKDGRVNNAIWVFLLAYGLHSTLKQGDTGPKVMALQRALRAAGATLKVDGQFGPQTADAVMQFQRSKGLTVDGVVGPVTLFSLGGGSVIGPQN